MIEFFLISSASYLQHIMHRNSEKNRLNLILKLRDTKTRSDDPYEKYPSDLVGFESQPICEDGTGQRPHKHFSCALVLTPTEKSFLTSALFDRCETRKLTPIRRYFPRTIPN